MPIIRTVVLEEPLKILLVEDNSADAGLIQANLRVGLGAVEVTRVDRLSGATDSLRQTGFSTVLLDLNLPDSSGLDTFHQLSSVQPGTPIVVLSGMDDSETAIEAVAAGAGDYVQKNDYNAHILARSVRFAIERSSRLAVERELMEVRSELRVAQNIQDRLYPTEAPQLPGFDIGYGIRSAGIGCGDYFDFVRLSDGRQLIVVGDVAGHGMGPAIVMAETRSCLRTLAALDVEPAVMMTTMNHQIYAGTSEGMFVTLMLVVIDPVARTFEYFNAGHPGWILNSTADQKLITHQIPLGMLLEVDHTTSDTIALTGGEILIVPTDGIQEAPRGEDMFGTQRMLDCVSASRSKSASDIVDDLFSAAMSFSGTEEMPDDMTAIVVKVD